MTTETTKHTFLSMQQHVSIEAAASLMVLNVVVRGEEWENNPEIQAAYNVLYEQARSSYVYKVSFLECSRVS